MKNAIKLEGVGLVNNRPSTDWLYHFVNEKIKKKNTTQHATLHT